MFGQSPEFEALLRSANVIAATDVSVLILGESGTGKELLARHLHQHSSRAEKPFITVNCAALPENLAESELFGHKKGAFTGATHDQSGRVQAANHGTLFLDEIGELPLSIQAKLLRFLENNECQAVGQAQPQQVNVRVVAATNRDLLTEVKAGNFREDLYYRLNIVPLQLPALRERASDIELLVKQLTQQLAGHYQLEAPLYDATALNILKQYTWPGNIRELRNLCERMLILLPGQTITSRNLPPEVKNTSCNKDKLCLPEQGIVLDKVEANLISQALSKTQGNQTHAARLLGITRSALLYRMAKYGINGQVA